MKKIGLVYLNLCMSFLVGTQGLYANSQTDVLTQSTKQNVVQEVNSIQDKNDGIENSNKKVPKRALAHLNTKRIIAYEQQVAATFSKNKWARIGLIGAGVGAAALGAWWYSRNASQNIPVPTMQQTIEALNSATEASRSLAESNVLIRLAASAATGSAKTVSQSWLSQAADVTKNTFSGINSAFAGWPSYFAGQIADMPRASIVGAGSALLVTGAQKAWNPLTRFKDRVFHEGDMNWYLETQTSIKTTFEEIYNLANSLVHADDERERESYKESIIHLYQKLIMSCERVLAFMMYQKKQYQQSHPYVASGIKMTYKHMYDDIETFTRHTQELLDEPKRHIAYPVTLQRFKEQLNNRIRVFKQFERFPDEPAVQ